LQRAAEGGASCTIQKHNVRAHFESKETESSENENAKIVGENNVDCFFDVNHEFLSEKQNANSKFTDCSFEFTVSGERVLVSSARQRTGKFFGRRIQAFCETRDLMSFHPPCTPDLGP
jgi:hypothetical protein